MRGVPISCLRCYGSRGMRPLKTFLSAMMLVLMIWAGGVAHAAERVDCIPAAAEAAGHYDGDGDQLPSDPDQGVAHHHTGCSGHHLAAPAGESKAPLCYSTTARAFPRNETGPPSHDPDNQLRPPIA